MAGDWVKWIKGLVKKPEVVRMAALLKQSRKETAADCMALWEWADDEIPDDHILENDSAFVTLSPDAGDNMAFIDGIVGTPKFADSMASVGWLRFRNDRVEFPNFGRHNGETAKTRARNAKNQKKKRGKQDSAKPPKEESGRQQPVTPVTNLSPSSGDISVTRGEEKRDKDPNGSKEPPNPQRGNGSSRPRSGVPAYMEAQVKEIYEAYPRKVGPDAAYKSIAKALGFIPFEELLAKVKLYAAARRQPGQDFKLTPHPSTWFNRGSWKEDPEQWKALDFEPRGSDLFGGINEFAQAGSP